MKWLFKKLSYIATFTIGFYLGMTIMSSIFLTIWVLSNSVADFRWEKDIDLKIKELQYKKLMEEQGE